MPFFIIEKSRLCVHPSGTALPRPPEALTHTPGTVIAPGKAVKGGGGARVITVWAVECVGKGVREERAVTMPRESAIVCWGLEMESLALSALLRPPTLEYLKLLIKHLLVCRMT